MNQLSSSEAVLNRFPGFGENKLVLSDKSFAVWRQFIYDNCGIYFQDNKKYLLESRLQKRINLLGLNSFEEYYSFITSNGNSLREKKYLYEAITINETYFFRNPPQFDALISNILPEIIQNKKGLFKNKIRIWSAASSSGEEPYTMAILIKEMIKPKYPNIEFEIVGTDINKSVIETAQKGIYKEYSIRNTPEYFLRKYFQANNGRYQIQPDIHKMTSFKLLNLYNPIDMKSMFNFDVIFCANVLIYFDVQSKIKVVSRLYDALNNGGYLFIGYSETLHGISKAFRLVSFPKTIGYKKD